MSDNYYFSSISQFVERIKKDYKDAIKSCIYFECKDCFKNKYEKICCLPVFMEIQMKGECENKFILHKDIFEMYDGQQLVVMFSENNKRKMEDKDKNCLLRLAINFEPQDFNGNTYYNSILRMVTNKTNIDKIRKQITVYKEEEIEIPDFAFPDVNFDN